MTLPTLSSPPSSGGSGRRKTLLAAGGGLVLLLAAVGFIRGGASEAEVSSESPQATRAAGSKSSGSGRGGSSGAGAQAPAVAEAEAAPRRFDATTCWQDLERFNDTVTIDTFREWSGPLLAAKDPLVRDYLKERLSELIGGDAGRATTVLGWAKDATPREFNVYMMALRDSEAVHQPQVAAKMLDLGLDATVAPERRAGILSALDTQKRLDGAALNRLTQFANDARSGEAGWAAARTIARVMKRDSKQTGNLAPYLDKLLTIAEDSPDEQIRYLGQMMPMHVAPVLDADATERFAKILATEGNDAGRDAAAQNLSLSTEREKVMALYAKTFESDPSLCVRWAVFRFSARMAGQDALPQMADMAMKDTRFQPVYHDFERLYASGTLDWVRIWNGLSNQDPFNCLDHHD